VSWSIPRFIPRFLVVYGGDREDPKLVDIRTHHATPRHLREAVEGSLKRLRLDRIDGDQLHVPDPVVPLDASMETLANM
jgi:aryl-alcohol dehydrogenase-like predicted oxidoreductase